MNIEKKILSELKKISCATERANMNDLDCWSFADVANYLRMSVSSFRIGWKKMVEEDGFPSPKMSPTGCGRKKLFPVKEVRAWLKSRPSFDIKREIRK